MAGASIAAPPGEYLIVTSQNKAATIRSTLHLPSVIRRPINTDGSARHFSKSSYAFVSLENVSTKTIEVWDAVWGGTTVFYASGSDKELPRSNTMRLRPPLEAELRIKLEPKQAICDSVGLYLFWDFGKMKDGTYDVSLYYDDEGFWPPEDKALEIGTIFYSFTVRVKGDNVYFEPRKSAD